MKHQDFVKVGIEVLGEDTASQLLMAQGLEAFVNLTRAAKAVHEPEKFLQGEFDWQGWDQALRQSLERFGLVFFKACQKRLAQRELPSAKADVHEFWRSVSGWGDRGTDSDDEMLWGGSQSDVEHDVVVVSEVAQNEVSVTPAHGDDVSRNLRGSSVEVTSRPQLVEDEVESFHDADAQQALADVEGLEGWEAPKAVKPQQAQSATLTPELLARLQSRLSARSWDSDSSRSVVPVEDPDVVMKEMKGRALNLMEGFHGNARVRSGLLVAQLSEASSQSFLGMCAHIPATVQKTFVEMLAALARVFQERDVHCADDVNEVFSRLLRFIDDDHLGFVHGLARKHEPQHGSWMGDAHHHWQALQVLLANNGNAVMNPGKGQRLVEEILDTCEDDDERQRRLVRLVECGLQLDTRVLRLLAPVQECLDDPALRALRRRVRDQIEVDDQASCDDDLCAMLPDNWPLMHLTAGRAAVLIGSAGKKHQVENIRDAFGFSSLDWVDSCRSLRRVQAVAASIKPGDERLFLVMHRFVSHGAADMIWAHRDNATVIGVDSGFGVHSVRRAIELHAGFGLKR